MGQYQKALEYFQSSLEIKNKTLGPAHPSIAGSLGGIGSVFLEQGQPEKAIGMLERVVALCENKPCEPEPYGRALYNLGGALVATNTDQMQAVALVKQAKKVFETTPKAFQKELQKIDKRLTHHSGK